MKDEILGPGICDGCGNEAPELLVINHRGVAGLCACRECAGKAWPVTKDRHAMTELKLLRDWCASAVAVINHGVDLMPLEQLSKWDGVRAVLEAAPPFEEEA